jgi:hypothetical protein
MALRLPVDAAAAAAAPTPAIARPLTKFLREVLVLIRSILLVYVPPACRCRQRDYGFA